MTGYIIGIGLLAVIALVAVAASFRTRDSTAAIGQLSDETLKRDRSGVDLSEEADAEPVVTGKAIEAAAKQDRGGALVRAGDGLPEAYVVPDPETIGVARRQFLNRSIVATFGLGLSSFGAAALAFLWPQGAGGFGSIINVGTITDIQAGIRAGGGFLYVPEGRMWVTEFPENALEKAEAGYSYYDQIAPSINAGVTALWQTCPHLGCRVPECLTSQWFECPCHGSQYNRVGEKKGGPAPRGMDLFPTEVNAANELLVNTGIVIQGPPIGINTTGQEAEGPNCVGGGEE